MAFFLQNILKHEIATRASALPLQDNLPNMPEMAGCVGTICRSDDGCCENMMCKLPEFDNNKKGEY